MPRGNGTRKNVVCSQLERGRIGFAGVSFVSRHYSQCYAVRRAAVAQTLGPPL